MIYGFFFALVAGYVADKIWFGKVLHTLYAGMFSFRI